VLFVSSVSNTALTVRPVFFSSALNTGSAKTWSTDV
jgi:hypothetical protein